MKKSKFGGILNQIEVTKSNSSEKCEGLTLEQVEEAAKYIFNNSKPQNTGRTIKISRYCKTYGAILDSTDHPDIKICNDRECTNCQNMLNLFKEAATNFKLDDHTKL